MFTPVASMEDQIRRSMEKAKEELGPDVIRIKTMIDDDWTGEPVIVFRVLISDAAVRKNGIGPISRRVSKRIENDEAVEASRLFPHFRFRTDAEQAALKDKDWM